MQTPGSSVPPFQAATVAGDLYKPCACLHPECITTSGGWSTADSPAKKRRAAGNFQQPFAERVVPFQSREQFPKPTGNFQSYLPDKMAAESASVNIGLLPTRGGAR
jgi:hypothetical protein